MGGKVDHYSPVDTRKAVGELKPNGSLRLYALASSIAGRLKAMGGPAIPQATIYDLLQNPSIIKGINKQGVFVDQESLSLLVKGLKEKGLTGELKTSVILNNITKDPNIYAAAKLVREPHFITAAPAGSYTSTSAFSPGVERKSLLQQAQEKQLNNKSLNIKEQSAILDQQMLEIKGSGDLLDSQMEQNNAILSSLVKKQKISQSKADEILNSGQKEYEAGKQVLQDKMDELKLSEYIVENELDKAWAKGKYDHVLKKLGEAGPSLRTKAFRDYKYEVLFCKKIKDRNIDELLVKGDYEQAFKDMAYLNQGRVKLYIMNYIVQADLEGNPVAGLKQFVSEKYGPEMLSKIEEAKIKAVRSYLGINGMSDKEILRFYGQVSELSKKIGSTYAQLNSGGAYSVLSSNETVPVNALQDQQKMLEPLIGLDQKWFESYQKEHPNFKEEIRSPITGQHVNFKYAEYSKAAKLSNNPQAVREIVKFTASIAIVITAAAVANVAGAAVTVALGVSASTEITAGILWAGYATEALVFTAASEAGNHCILGTPLFQGGLGGYVKDSAVNLLMFRYLAILGKGSMALTKGIENETVQKVIGFGLESAGFTAWGMGEQTVTAAVSDDLTMRDVWGWDLKDAFSKLGTAYLENTKFLIGLKAGHAISRPIIEANFNKIRNHLSNNLAGEFQKLESEKQEIIKNTERPLTDSLNTEFSENINAYETLLKKQINLMKISQNFTCIDPKAKMANDQILKVHEAELARIELFKLRKQGEIKTVKEGLNYKVTAEKELKSLLKKNGCTITDFKDGKGFLAVTPNGEALVCDPLIKAEENIPAKENKEKIPSVNLRSGNNSGSLYEKYELIKAYEGSERAQKSKRIAKQLGFECELELYGFKLEDYNLEDIEYYMKNIAEIRKIVVPLCDRSGNFSAESKEDLKEIVQFAKEYGFIENVESITKLYSINSLSKDSRVKLIKAYGLHDISFFMRALDVRLAEKLMPRISKISDIISHEELYELTRAYYRNNDQKEWTVYTDDGKVYNKFSEIYDSKLPEGEILVRKIRTASDPATKVKILKALQEISPDDYTEHLTETIKILEREIRKSPERGKKIYTLKLLAEISQDSYVNLLIETLSTPNISYKDAIEMVSTLYLREPSMKGDFVKCLIKLSRSKEELIENIEAFEHEGSNKLTERVAKYLNDPSVPPELKEEIVRTIRRKLESNWSGILNGRDIEELPQIFGECAKIMAEKAVFTSEKAKEISMQTKKPAFTLYLLSTAFKLKEDQSLSDQYLGDNNLREIAYKTLLEQVRAGKITGIQGTDIADLEKLGESERAQQQINFIKKVFYAQVPGTEEGRRFFGEVNKINKLYEGKGVEKVMQASFSLDKKDYRIAMMKVAQEWMDRGFLKYFTYPLAIKVPSGSEPGEKIVKQLKQLSDMAFNNNIDIIVIDHGTLRTENVYHPGDPPSASNGRAIARTMEILLRDKKATVSWLYKLNNWKTDQLSLSNISPNVIGLNLYDGQVYDEHAGGRKSDWLPIDDNGEFIGANWNNEGNRVRNKDRNIVITKNGEGKYRVYYAYDYFSKIYIDEVKRLRNEINAGQVRKDLKIKNILFVCNANHDRSPLAEMLFKKICEEKLEVKEGYSITSAGLATEQWLEEKGAKHDNPFVPSPGTRSLLGSLGIDYGQFKKQQITNEIAMKAELIVVMTKREKSKLLEMFPECQGRVYVLRELAGYPEAEWDISTPREFTEDTINTFKGPLQKIFNNISY